jgi:hypothetical protein
MSRASNVREGSMSVTDARDCTVFRPQPSNHFDCQRLMLSLSGDYGILNSYACATEAEWGSYARIKWS